MNNEYWMKVKEDAGKEITFLLGNKWAEKVREIVGDDNGIDERADVVKVLAYILKHGNYEQVACAILSVGDWQLACHKLAEHGQAGA